jgi:mono/diheme cytochrome c family protein
VIKRAWSVGVAAWSVLIVVSAISLGAQSISVKSGVYTDAQATKGEAVFNKFCASCHTPGFFTDKDFFANYGDKPLWDLMDMISDSMPQDNPGSLKHEEYAQIIAYVLKLNKYPAGTTEVPMDKEGLSNILLEKP